MYAFELKNRSRLSTILSLFFFILLTGYLGYLEFIKQNTIQTDNKLLIQSPIREDLLDGVVSIRFKNRIGQFSLSKKNEHWVLQEPNIMPAKIKTIKKIIDTLRSISIHTIHAYEPINIQSFSLDKPVITVDIYSKLDDKATIKFGLVNPINNTSYLTVTGHDYIYQINHVKNDLERLGLSDFIDAKIFSFDSNDIVSFKLFHRKEKKPFNKLTQNNGLWKSHKYNQISNTRTTAKISSILNIKTHTIIDKQNNEINNFINNYIKHPLYRIKIKTKNGKTINYVVTHLIKKIKELKIGKREYFIMTASNRAYPYLISKDQLPGLNIRYSDIK